MLLSDECLMMDALAEREIPVKTLYVRLTQTWSIDLAVV